MIKRVVKMTFRPESVAEFKEEVFEKSKAAIRAFPGCRYMELLCDTEHPDVLFTLSVWENAEALQSYRDSALFKKTWAATKALFAGRAEAWSLEVIDAP
ncbi:MAG: putative quinol monooxygenase [Saprospiraceae bacterium]